MRRIFFTSIFAFCIFFSSIFLSSAYFAKFLISPELVNISVPSLETSSQNITVSLDPSYDYGGEEAQYKISREIICNVYNEEGDCVDGPPDLCPYISLEDIDQESYDNGFLLDPSFPFFTAKGQLYIPGDEEDHWTLSITSPCFEGECPLDYDANRFGDPLPQSLKNQTFNCDLVVESGFFVPVRSIGAKTTFAATSNKLTISAIFTGEVATQTPNPVIIIPGIAGTELYNGNDLIWMDLDQMFVDINDQFLNILSLNNQGEPNNALRIGDIIESKTFMGKELNIFKDLNNYLKNNSYQENQNLFFFPYDWRLDLDQTKDLLKQKIDEVKAQTGKDKVNIVAHSMGGLLVKDYLNQYGKESIDKLIFVGTPHLGAPKAGKVILEGDRFGIPWLEEDRIKEIARNSPALHELLPNQTYFDTFQGYLREYSFFGENPLLNYMQTKDFFLNEKNQNSMMFQKTEDFYNKNLDNFNFDGLDTYNIAGCKTGTQSAYSFDIFGGIGQTGYTSGDGTVPLVSSDYISIPNQNKYYVKDADHAELPSINGVRNLILEILNGGVNNLAENVSNDSSFCNFKGKKLTWHSPVEIHIYDSNGNHTGPIENNAIEYGISGIDYDVIGHNKFVFLPIDRGQEYLVEAMGLEESSFDLSISEVENGQYLTTQIFNDVPVTTSAIASFAVNNSVNSSIEVEDQGKIVEVPADTTLEGETALDLTPPETKAKTEWIKDKKQKKNLQITLTATDNQSGILETAYSLDEGKTFGIYSNPIITEKKLNKILFYSVDKAGNNEEVKEFDIDKNKPDKCKSWKCLDINEKHNVVKKIYKKLKSHNPKIIKIIKNLKLIHR